MPKLYGSWSEVDVLKFKEDTYDITLQPNASTTYTAARVISLPNTDSNDELVSLAATQTLTNKTFTSPTLSSPVLTTPQINDTSSDHQYIFAVSELAADRTITLPLLAGNDTFVFLAHAGTLTNKTIDAASNTISNIANANISGSAAIAYSKLSLTDSIVDADIDSAAAIAYSKLDLADSIVDADINSAAAIAYSKLDLADSIVDADIATAAAIAYSKLAALTASRALVSDGDGEVSVATTTATEIGYVNGVTSAIQTQLNAKAALAGATFTGNVVIDNAKEIRFSETDANGSHYIGIKAPDSVTADVTFVLPDGDGSANQVLKTDGALGLGWATVATVEESLVSDAPAATYAIADGDESVHVLTPSEACTVTLDNDFAAGRTITIINASSSYDITVKANDASTICTIYRSTRNRIMCTTGTPADNTDWHVLDKIVSPWIDDTPSIASDGGAAAPGSGATHEIFWKRDGKTMIVRYALSVAAAGTAGSGDYYVTVPNSKNVDSDFFPASGLGADARLVGPACLFVTATEYYGFCYIPGGQTARIKVRAMNEGTALTDWSDSLGTLGSANAREVGFTATIPINEWEDFSG